MQLFVTGFSHRTAPLELREKLSLKAAEIEKLIPALREEGILDEAVILNTCNRTEIYGVARRLPASHEAIFEKIFSAAFNLRPSAFHGRDHPGKGDCLQPPGFAELEKRIYGHAGEAGVHHLFRVAGGLDSMVIGETEIFGQVKQAYQLSHGRGGTGKILNKLFQKAFSTAKEIRAKFGITRFPTSMGSIAANLASQLFGDKLIQSKALIIGAGKMGETTLRHLVKRGIGSLLIANRSLERAEELAREFDGGAVSLYSLSEVLPLVDIVISSTDAPHYILGKREIAEALKRRQGRPLFLIDLAVPRDIEPAVEELEGVYLFNMDQLGDIAKENMTKREESLIPCEELAAAHARKFFGWLTSQQNARRSTLDGQIVEHGASIIEPHNLATTLPI